MENIVITKHATKRIKERTGLKKKNYEKYAQEAFTVGIKHNETKGSLKKYIDYLYLKHRSGNNIRIYHRVIWIFAGNSLITVFGLDNKFHKIEDKLKKQINSESI